MASKSTPGLRAAIYARMSTDKQDPSSPEAQIEECLALAKKNGFSVSTSHIFKDERISGAEQNRPAYRRMVEMLRAGDFDIVLAEDTSRIARDERILHDFLGQLD